MNFPERAMRNHLRSPDGWNVSIAAQSGSHITAPVLSNNNITGNVQIIHNAPERRSILLKYKELIRKEYQYVTEYNSLPGEHRKRSPPEERLSSRSVVPEALKNPSVWTLCSTQTNETLLTACSIPVICWIIGTVIRERLNDGADATSGLETTTSIYVDFLCTLLEHHSQGSGQSVPTLVKSLGQLAEKGILAQQVLFDEKTVYEMVSDPAGSPFLCKFLFKKRIHQETMFSFMHLSFQEFFTALYYLLMDEYESKKKLMQMVSIHKANVNDQYSAPRFAAVVHFIFGLLNEDVRRTLWKRHGLFVHSNIQDHLKEWILEEMSHSRSERTLFLFHCLYELHEEDFVKEVTEACPSVFLHSAVIRKTDCWSMVYCAQCCQSIKDMFISCCCSFTSEELAIVQPVLHKFLSIKFDMLHISNSDLGGMMDVLMRERTLSSQRVIIDWWFDLKISEELSRIAICRTSYHPEDDLKKISLSFPSSVLVSIDWIEFFQTRLKSDTDILLFLLHSFSVQKLELNLSSLTKAWAHSVLNFTWDYPSLREISLEADRLLEEAESVLKKSHPRPDCTLTVQGFRCNKSSKQCTDQRVKIHVSKQGFFVEVLRRPLFPD
ncbi:NACHT, LRR and PYD domains-containing protein 1 homolog [Onychostoma macrolepis]|uniref:NACHT, LRR and PYD domains-containing protein 1 homolog n=1 Tax=Onychostoma macrolepis TaxID=369639 RepID=UPI00272CB08D|nr:NACHT, LRR and PYD domains-containing protein 1 homolog [Onychostoma macrolepis]